MKDKKVSLFRPFKGKKCRNCSKMFSTENDIFKSIDYEGNIITDCSNCNRKNIIYKKTGELHLVTRKQEQSLRKIDLMAKLKKHMTKVKK